MSLLKKLFGGPAKPAEPQVEEYEGFRIFPEPANEGSHFRLAARIEKEIAGEVKSHMLIRADTFTTPEQAADAAVMKAKQLIGQMGDRLFG